MAWRWRCSTRPSLRRHFISFSKIPHSVYGGQSTKITIVGTRAAAPFEACPCFLSVFLIRCCMNSRYLDKKDYLHAHQVACLGVTENHWRTQAIQALGGLNFKIARKVSAPVVPQGPRGCLLASREGRGWCHPPCCAWLSCEAVQYQWHCSYGGPYLPEVACVAV